MEDERSHTGELPVAARRGIVAVAGHQGDEATVRSYLEDATPSVRATALSALVRLGKATALDTARSLADPDPSVRRSACEHGALLPGADFGTLLDDEDPSVVEAAAYALGEVAASDAVGALCDVARSHADPLCRESAVAALGAIGDPRAKAAVIAALEDVPAIRRRAAIACSAFEGADVLAALRAHVDDRDWQVRQAVEDVLALSDEPER